MTDTLRRRQWMWALPPVVVGAWFALWALNGHWVFSYRIAMPLLVALALAGVFRQPRAVRKEFIPLLGGCATLLVMAITTREGAGVDVSWLRDGWRVGVVVAVGAAAGRRRGFFARRRARQELPDVVALTAAVASFAFAALRDVWPRLDAPTFALVVVFVVANSFALGVIITSTALQTSWTVPNLLVAGGVVVALVNNVAYMHAHDSGRSYDQFVWTWMAGTSLVAAALFHPELLKHTHVISQAFKLRFSLVAIFAAVVAGAVVLASSTQSPALLCAGLVTVAVAMWRSGRAVLQSWHDRRITARAIEHEIAARDAERRELKRLVHDDVLQLLVVAAWEAPPGEAVARILQAEKRTREILDGLGPLVPMFIEFEEALQAAVGSRCYVDADVALGVAFVQIRATIWECVHRVVAQLVSVADVHKMHVRVVEDAGWCVMTVRCVDAPVMSYAEWGPVHRGLRHVRDIANAAGGAVYLDHTACAAVVELPLPQLSARWAPGETNRAARSPASA